MKNKIIIAIVFCFVISSFFLTAFSIQKFSYSRNNLDFSHNFLLMEARGSIDSCIDLSPKGIMKSCSKIYLDSLKTIDRSAISIMVYSVVFGLSLGFLINKFASELQSEVQE